MTILASTPRRALRYTLFRMKGGTHHNADMPADKAPLVAPLEELMRAAGVTIDGFATEWDLGIDDVATMHSRPGSWWCWGKPRSDVVAIDKTSIRDGLRSIVARGYGALEVWNPQDAARPGCAEYAEAGVRFTRADYVKILAAGKAAVPARDRGEKVSK